MKNDFEKRRQRRIDNAKHRAEKNSQESEKLYLQAKKMASVIPFGQPILVGHHSEKRDRNYRNKIHNTYGKAFAKSDKAEYYWNKAETIESNDAIFSDDPEALEKLKSKLKELHSNHEFMKAANKCIRKRDKNAFLQLPHATAEMWDELLKPSIGGVGFASFSLKNNAANIRNVEQRIQQISHLESKAALDIQVNGIRIYENKEAGRLQIIFPGKPDDICRKLLKKSGFRWSPSQGAWQRHISPNAIYHAKEIVGKINGPDNA